MKLILLIQSMVLIAILTIACSTQQVVQTATTTTQAYLLIQDLERVEVRLTALPLSSTERLLIDQGLHNIRGLLGEYEDPANLLLDLPIARLKVDQGAGAFLTTQRGYQMFLERTNTAPDPSLLVFESVAVDFHDDLLTLIDELEAQGQERVRSQVTLDHLSMIINALVLVL